MGRSERLALIHELQGLRQSKVLTYVTGDRPPATAQIGDDAVRPIFEHLRKMGRVERLDLFLYTRGGAIDVPWRIVSALRSAAEEWNILIPFRANSAGTLLALGADKIVMGPQAELGPIDPRATLMRTLRAPNGDSTVVQDQVSVEDVMAYVKFVKERGDLREDEARIEALNKLVERVDAVALGSIYRTHLHIRDVAQRILLSRREPANEATIKAIVSTLAEKVYAHGHAINFHSASELGLPVELAVGETDRIMWALLEEYESELKLRQPLDPSTVVKTQDVYTELAALSAIESEHFVHRFLGEIEARAKRQMPQNLQLNLSVQVNLPPGALATTPPAVQALLQQITQQAQQAAVAQVTATVQQAVRAQATLIGVDVAFRDGKWVREA